MRVLAHLVLAPIAAFLLLANGSSVVKPDVTSLEVEIEDGQMLLSFQLDRLFDDEFRRRIDSGLATEIGFDMRLVKVRRWWLDRNIGSSKLQVTVMYNAVTREYLINTKQDGGLISSRVVRFVDELEEAMTRVERLAAFALDDPRRSGRVQVRVRAELGTGTRLWFIPTTRTTDWTEARLVLGVDGVGDPSGEGVGSPGVPEEDEMTFFGRGPDGLDLDGLDLDDDELDGLDLDDDELDGEGDHGIEPARRS